MRIAIVGAGGAGGYFGTRWAQAGLDVGFVARGAHLEAIRASGLRVESPLGDATVRVPATAEPAEIGVVDLVVVATKTWQLPAACEHLAPLVGESTVVFGLQNGVEAADVLATAVEPSRVLVATCRILSFVAAPGVVRHVGAKPLIRFGEATGGRSLRVEAIDSALRVGPTAFTEAVDDIRLDLWRKFLFFAPLSGVGSVTRAPAGVLREQPETRRWLEAAVREVYALAIAEGVGLEPRSVEQTLDFIDGLPPDGTTSMQRDVIAGRRTELEALAGAVVRLGRRHGVATPVHEMIYAALLPQERRARAELVWE